MELVEGDDARGRIARGPIPLDEALPIAKQIAEALEAAHEQGIIHRDLKPANIKVRPDGTVKVLDFGLAKAMEPAAGSSPSVSMSPTITTPAMTQAGMILGTAAYMSPEQAQGQTVDKRADIWAFGCVLFEMLTGNARSAAKTCPSDVSSVAAGAGLRRASAHGPRARQSGAPRVPAEGPEATRARHGDVRLALEGAFETAVAQTATSVPVVARGRAREYVAWGLATVATLMAVGASVLYLRVPRQTDTIVRFTVPPPAGAVRPAGAGFAVSPDSQLLAFVAKGADGVSRIFVRHLDAAEAQPLAGTDRAGAPFWAPDGGSLGFGKEGGLYRVALDGSAPRLLCSVPGGVSGGTWSVRGVIVFASRSGLLQVPDTGGTPTPVTTLDAGAKETSHIGPWFLPDGRRLLFLALADEQLRGTIWATAIDDPARTRIVESSGGAAYAAGWLLSTTATPRSLVAQPFDPEHLTLQGTPQRIRDRLSNANTLGFRGFAVSSSGVLVVDRPPPTVSQLVWMDRSGREVATVSPRASLPEFALASDERRVVARVTSPDGATRALWLFDGIRPEGTRLTYEGRATRPMWALDGRHVYFTDTIGNEFALRTLAIGATAPTAFEKPRPVRAFRGCHAGWPLRRFQVAEEPLTKSGSNVSAAPSDGRSCKTNLRRLGRASLQTATGWRIRSVCRQASRSSPNPSTGRATGLRCQ